MESERDVLAVMRELADDGIFCSAETTGGGYIVRFKQLPQAAPGGLATSIWTEELDASMAQWLHEQALVLFPNSPYAHKYAARPQGWVLDEPTMRILQEGLDKLLVNRCAPTWGRYAEELREMRQCLNTLRPLSGNRQ